MTEVNHSVRRLSALRDGIGATSYLEIGVQNGITFNAFDIARKDAVDPKFNFDTDRFANEYVRFFEVSSDDFFLNFVGPTRYDLVFLDGLHTFEQTFRDFCASLAHAKKSTVWLIDDIMPVDIFSAHPNQHEAVNQRKGSGKTNKDWHGDVYKVVFAIHDFFPTLTFRTIQTGGNPQLVVWTQPRGNFGPRFNNLETISRLDYFTLQKHLDLYNFGLEADVLAEVVASVTALRSD